MEDSESVDGLVSIIIPMFNSERWIEQTLQSVISQTYEFWECIVINDGSTDSSPKLVEEVANRYPNRKISFFTIQNSGVSVARNTGIGIADGEFVAFLDSDDIWLPNKLQEQVAAIAQSKAIGAVLCDYFILKTRENGLTKRQQLVSQSKIERIGRNWLSLEGNGAFLSSTALIRKSVLSDRLQFDKELGLIADLYFYLCLERLTTIASVPLPLAEYRQHGTQMHHNPYALKSEWKIMLAKLDLSLSPLKRSHLEANVLILAGLMSLNSRNFKHGFLDLWQGVQIRPLSLVTMPFHVTRKKIWRYTSKLMVR